jgi:predicted HicB family RNase H-like nuclease
MDKAAMNVNIKRLVVELDPQIHKEIKLQAVREGKSYRELITDCFNYYIAIKQSDPCSGTSSHGTTES